ITVSTWLAPVALTVEGSAASEQTWIMFFPGFPPDYTAARRAGEGLDPCHGLAFLRCNRPSFAKRHPRGTSARRANQVGPFGSCLLIKPAATKPALEVLYFA